MHRSLQLGALTVMAALAAPAAGAAPAPRLASPAGPAARAAAVTIRDFTFAPAILRVARGTVVTVRNRDSTNHTFTSRSGAFGVSNLASGHSARVRFNHRGTYRYYCAFHPFMHGRVIVH